jgi:hypothetical protein
MNDEFGGTRMNGRNGDSSREMKDGGELCCLFGFHEEKTPD